MILDRIIVGLLALALACFPPLASAQSPQIRQLVLTPQQPPPAPAPTAQSFVTAKTGMQYITTTWTHAPTDPKKATIAYWRKFIALNDVTYYAFTTATVGSIIFDNRYSTSTHQTVRDDGGGSAYNIDDNGSMSDLNWHHICIQIDTTQATPVHIFLDGVDSGTTGTQPSLNSDMGITANGIASYIGEVVYEISVSNGIPDAKWAYVYLIDGQALPASSFTSGTLGSIHPITYTGTYGNNGFFLNGNGGTSGSVPDQSGNGNNFTAPNNITYSADVPT